MSRKKVRFLSTNVTCELFSLKWNDHKNTFFDFLSNAREKKLFCDATLVCEGKFYLVHRFVLSTCSDYFEKILENISAPHPVIVLANIKPKEIEDLLQYMYTGEVKVLKDEIDSFIKAGEVLKIKGLVVTNEKDKGKTQKRNINDIQEVPEKRQRTQSVQFGHSSKLNESSRGLRKNKEVNISESSMNGAFNDKAAIIQLNDLYKSEEGKKVLQEAESKYKVNAAKPLKILRTRSRVRVGAQKKTKVTKLRIQKKTKLNSYDFCKGILVELFAKKHHTYAWPFYHPVDPEKLGIPDYPQIVANPMDLSTVKDKLVKKSYNKVADFIEDIRLIFQNCYSYNKETEDITIMAKKVEKIFEDSLTRWHNCWKGLKVLEIERKQIYDSSNTT